MKFYRKQPLEAEQFDGSQKLVFGYSVIPSGLIDEITGKPVYYSMLVDDVCQDSDDDTGVVLEVGDWIVKEADGIEVIADDVFKKTYAELPVIPVEIANAIEEYRDRFGSAKGINELITDMNAPWKLGVLETVTAIPGIILGVFRSKTDVLARAWLDGYQTEGGKI